MQLLSDALVVNKSLELLQLEDNPLITETGVQQFVLCLQDNHHLKKLTVDEYRLSDTSSRPGQPNKKSAELTSFGGSQ